MFLRRFSEVFVADIKCIARMPLLLTAVLSPLIILAIQLFASGYISGLKDAEKVLPYYTVIAIFLISAVPFIFGLVFSFIQLAGKRLSDKNESVQPAGEKRDLFIMRLVISGLSALIIVLPAIFFTDAVTTEGWLRSIYVSLLLATMAPFICAFSAGSGGSLFRWRIRSVISILFILPVPFGLILHHPWNYLAFFSPFYWINWAWIIPSPLESLIYGLISMAITVAGLLVLYRRHSRYTTI